MRNWVTSGLAVCCLLAAVLGCGRSGSPLPSDNPGLDTVASNLGEPGSARISGDPGLLSGLRSAPDPDATPPLPHFAAQAGRDFASNRFIAIFENQPQSQAIAPYLDGDAPGTGSDVVSARDNRPLVQHPFLRKVSVNLARQYGLSLYGRVFYKDVNFAVYEMTDPKDVSELDNMMRQVLSQNKGLVREVCYDFTVRVVGGPESGKVGALPGKLQDLAHSTPVKSNTTVPTAAAPASNRTVSSPPTYDNPDPFYLNQYGGNTNTGDGGNDSGTWALWRIGATLDQAWSYTTGSSSVMVAVVDTGVRYTHEDIEQNCIDPLTDAPYNAEGILTDTVNKDNDPWDGHSHGTFCAGEIGAKGNNGKGLAGVNWNVTLLPVKVLSDGGYGTDAQVAEGMLLADYLGANVISMSLGGWFGDRTTQLACKQCNSDGVLICSAAGKSNMSVPFYPAYYPECLAVGASTLVNNSNDQDFSNSGSTLPVDTRYDARAGFSCYGPWVDIASPGVLSLSIANSGDSNYNAGWAGTSMATPYVAGCSALLWSYISNPTNDKVRALLQSSSTTMDHLCNQSDPKGFIDPTTNGTVKFVNVYKALQLYGSGVGSAPTVTWDNPVNGATVSGTVELRVSVSGGSGSVTKVEFENFARQLGVTTAPSGGFYRVNWDSSYEFNRPIELRAKVYDDKGNIVTSTITVTPNNSRKTPNWTEGFDGTGNNALPGGWFKLDGNQGSSNTAWGADPSQFVTAAPSLHSNGTSANYVGGSQDWLIAPVIDLKNYATANLGFSRRFQTGGGDEIYLLLTSDDKTYAYSIFSNNALQDWGTYNYDLSAFAGQEVRVIWALTSYGNSGQGIWLDDINLSGAAGTPPTISITSPANGATVNGRVPITMTVSDDTTWITLNAEPPDLGNLIFTPIPDNDALNPTKTYTINWDSRHVYNGGALLTAMAWDDENGNSLRDDLSARAQVSVSVNNSTRNPVWFDGFESIGTLGGFSGSNFDGDWFVWQSSSNTWRTTTTAGQFHSGAKGIKFGPVGPGNYGANELGQLYSPVHDCSGASRPYLRFWQQLDVEDGGGNGDIAQLLLVHYDGLDDVEMPVRELHADTAAGWQEVDVPLSTWKSSKFRFNFIFSSDGDANVGKGWWIDDYEILDADPHINNLAPARGIANGTTQITINGLRFGNVQGSSTVSFAKAGGGRTTAAIVSWSNTQVVVKVPADATSGSLLVNLLGFDSNAADFRVILAPPNLGGLGQL